MLSRAPAATLAVLALAALALASACDDNGAAGDATPTAMAQSPTAPAATNTPSQSIRDVDFEAVEDLAGFIAAAGDVSIGRIEYADLTYDNAEEAVVLISSGGEGGDIAVFVYTEAADGVERLLLAQSDQGPVRAELVGGKLRISEPEYAPGDPLCCPSALKTSVYDWDGDALVVVEETTE